MSEDGGVHAASVAAPAVLSVPGADWDQFVAGHAEAPVYLRSAWSLLIRDVFRHSAFFIEARDARGQLAGVLPIVRQRGLLGDFATSLPFFNYGGPLANSNDIALQLMDAAREHVRKLGCSYLELRDMRERGGSWQTRTDKVTMILELPQTAGALAKQLGSKLRSQIKRAEREQANVRSGGLELLDDFYAVFAENMRDLGTPVYPKRFFRAILERFPHHARIVSIECRGVAAAAGFLVIDAQRAEIPWASCRAGFKPLGMNMKLYWEVLTHAIGAGCNSFDFGRSTADSGTFRFKQQWGAQPVQLYWHRWERNPSKTDVAEAGSHGRLMSYAVATWQRLPLPLANALGPLVSPGLPW
jgi:FemAB-related protein (PEP-CTERM system-associated)